MLKQLDNIRDAHEEFWKEKMRKRGNTIRGFILGAGAFVFLLVSSSSVCADPIPAGG